MPRLWIVVALMVAVTDCTHSRACSTRHRFVLSGVASADRLEVLGWNSERVTTITDPVNVKAAMVFITERSDGFSEVLAGPQAPWLQIEFRRGSETVQSFGLAPTYLVDGPLSRPTPPEQIEALMRQLDLQWPKR